jgi:hypothetical protein
MWWFDAKKVAMNELFILNLNNLLEECITFINTIIKVLWLQ